MAQKGQLQFLKVKALKNSDKALNPKDLEALALRYVSRYATTKHKLKSYLHRKVREKGGEEDHVSVIIKIAEKYEQLGYIDDALFAEHRASSLLRRGYGERRIEQALKQAGIDKPNQVKALKLSEKGKWDAAEKFAQKRRIGPYASEQYDRAKCQKMLQAFMRAGHGYEIAAKFVFAKPGEMVEQNF
ncbi:MAG: RecX family transcriptional regulator [Parasphingorhabdus sp.]